MGLRPGRRDPGTQGGALGDLVNVSKRRYCNSALRGPSRLWHGSETRLSPCMHEFRPRKAVILARGLHSGVTQAVNVYYVSDIRDNEELRVYRYSKKRDAAGRRRGHNGLAVGRLLVRRQFVALARAHVGHCGVLIRRLRGRRSRLLDAASCCPSGDRQRVDTGNR